MATSPDGASPRGSGGAARDRPCDNCRRRKIRCLISAGGKSCVLCDSRSQECTFVQDPPRKKRRVEGSPEVPNPRTNTKAAPSHVVLPVDDYSRLPGPSLLKQTLGHQNRQSSSFLGLTTDYDAKLMDLAQFDEKDELSTPLGTIRRASSQRAIPRTHFMMRPDTQSETTEEIASLDDIEAVVYPHGPALVELYFRIVHPSFPILHKKVFLEKHGRTYRELTPLGLIAVYILALHWWSYSTDLASMPQPDVKNLERMVPKLMADCWDRPKISDLQAGLVLSQRPGGEDSWTLTGQLVAMAQNLGIHVDCSDWRVPDWERGVRKRVAWALFAQDKWGALVYGRPSLITNHNWDVMPLEVRDFPETSKDDDDEEGSSEVEKGRLIFVNLISLTMIMAEILDTFFTLKGTKRLRSTMEVLEKAKPIQMRLKTWHTKLPPSLSIDETKSRKLSSAGYLHLAYFTAEVTLHRAIVRSLDHPETDEQLRSITRAAARMRLTSSIEFVKRLRQEHLLSFWYFASKRNLSIIGIFGSLLWTTSESGEERKFYKAQLAEYRWTLRISSTGADFMKYTIGVLDASTTFLSKSDSNGAKFHGHTETHENNSGHGAPTLEQAVHSSGETFAMNLNSEFLDNAEVTWDSFPSINGPIGTPSHEWYSELESFEPPNMQPPFNHPHTYHGNTNLPYNENSKNYYEF